MLQNPHFTKKLLAVKTKPETEIVNLCCFLKISTMILVSYFLFVKSRASVIIRVFEPEIENFGKKIQKHSLNANLFN